MRLGSATVGLGLVSVDLKASWSPSRCPPPHPLLNPPAPPFCSLCELEMRGVLLCLVLQQALSWGLCYRVHWTMRKHQ